MSRLALLPPLLLACCALGSLGAVEPDRDFTGRWLLDSAASDFRALPGDPEQSLAVTQQPGAILCSASYPGGATAQWKYRLDGSDSKFQMAGETRNSAVKWEGSALLINTLVSGTRNYVVMDRWKLSRGYTVLTITRQVIRGTAQSEGQLVYRREDQETQVRVASTPEPPRSPEPSPRPLEPEPQPEARVAVASEGHPHVLPTPLPPQPPVALSRKPEPEPDARIAVPAGTRILLETLNGIDTKHSHVGDRIYLRTAFPVVVDGRVAIPRGAAVTGSITAVKQPGHGAGGKGELFLRFDSLTFPNGVTRDFRSRLGNADGDIAGKVDSREGKITGERNTGHDARTVAEGTGIGASVGGIAGTAAGHAGMGVGLGAAGGAAAGLASILLKRGPDAALPKGTTVHMVLDRELRFREDELRF